MEQSFEAEVLARLAVIESKLDGYKDMKKTVYEADTRSKENETEIKEIQDKLKWISRTVIGAVIALVIGTIKIGWGV